MNTLKTALIGAVTLFGVTGAAWSQAGLNDLEVAHSAYTADIIDIDYAKIALEKSKNPEVRAFAELMIRDHTAVNEGAAALLAKLKVKAQDNAFSQTLIEGATAEKTKLSALDGAAFDRAYAANELAYHQVVNKTVGDIWIPNIQNAEVKAFFVKALATFKIHEAHASHMVETLKTAQN
jgi:putative membrane protein